MKAMPYLQVLHGLHGKKITSLIIIPKFNNRIFMPRLYYFHDPMCSWCYAFDVALKRIEANLPDSLSLIKILGGLAADSTEPMPEVLQNAIKANWQRIEQTVPHVQFNYDFWDNNQPIRSTYPACRAVLAAKKQAVVFEDKMIQQIQWAYYKNAANPSLNETLYNCAKVVGLDVDAFKVDYHSSMINHQLQKQIKLARLMGVSSYPSLLLKINNKLLPIKVDYNDEQSMLRQLT